MKNKKVGIITYFYYYNYGTMLQAYALMRAVKDRGYDCQIIDYRFGEKQKSKLQMLIIRIKRLFVYLTTLRRVVRITKYKDKMAMRQKYFHHFLKANMVLSPKTYRLNTELTKDSPQYDVYLTGSDQTWSPKIGFNSALFLNFANPKSILGAYAPSIGVASLTEEHKEYLRVNLVKYDFLSCRETLGAKLLSEITEREVTKVLDPTLLITKEQWRELSKPVVENKTPYILCYFLGHRNYYRNFVKQLKKQTGYEVYFIPVSYVDFEKKNRLLFDVGPAEFIHLIDNAEIVCTDSFHGLAFSSNLNKNFYAFVKHEGAIDGGDNSRIFDYLNQIELTDRLIPNFQGDQIEIKPINYTKTNRIIEFHREKSNVFLSTILNYNK